VAVCLNLILEQADRNGLQEFLVGRLPPIIETLLRNGARFSEEDLNAPREPIPGLSDKEGSKDVPGWCRGLRPMIRESGKDFAKRLMDEEFGPGKYDKGPTSDYNKIRKWGDRSFRIPASFFPDST
jgi:hypothetical protein